MVCEHLKDLEEIVAGVTAGRKNAFRHSAELSKKIVSPMSIRVSAVRR